jgi:hypothetical protein
MVEVVGAVFPHDCMFLINLSNYKIYEPYRRKINAATNQSETSAADQSDVRVLLLACRSPSTQPADDEHDFMRQQPDDISYSNEDNPTWSCSACTFANELAHSNCEVSTQSKPTEILTLRLLLTKS